MKRVVLVCICLLCGCFPTFNCLAAGPLGVSPGGGSGDAVVGTAFPTFSWSAVEEAVGYRLEIFKEVEGALSHEEMSEKGELVIGVEIPAPALSWTPSGTEALKTGESYIWYVKALDSEGKGNWSFGNRFRMDAAVALNGMEEAVREKVTEYAKTDTEFREAIRQIIEQSSSLTDGGTSAAGDGDLPAAGRLGGMEGTSVTSYGLDAGTTGSANTFIGRAAGYYNTGYYNTFLGDLAGYSNTTGNYNTFLGDSAGYFNTTGNFNTFLGDSAGYSNTTGNNNTFLGDYAGYYNTTGNYNTFLGDFAGISNTTGNSNTFLGHYAGYSNTTGHYNTFLGDYAGVSNTTGNYNTFLGDYAGYSNTTGYRNVFLGYQAGYNETGSDRLYIHNSDSTSPLIYGDFNGRTIQINGSLNIADASAASDISFKRDIKPLEGSLEKVTSLKGVSFAWRTDQYPEKGFRDGRQIGLIAQDVEKVLPELVKTDKDGKKSLSYDKLTAVLVEAVKAQQKEIAAQEARLEKQAAEIAEFKRLFQKVISKDI